MNLKDLERIVDKIQSNLFRNSNAFAIGMLKSNFKGSGIQFKEHQVYAPGDDVRFIDWKLSAKTSHTFVKTFEEERNVNIVVVVDVTQSMLTGYKGISKLQASLEIACLMNLLAAKTKDKVSTIFFFNEPHYLPYAFGHQGIAQIFSFLEKKNLITTEGKINFKADFDFTMEQEKKFAILKSLVAKGREVVFLSDFNSLKDISTLEKLIYRRNMHCFRVVGPLDTSMSTPFSLFGKFQGKNYFTKAKAKNENNSKINGRWKLISVKDQYLDQFVRDML